MLKRRPRAGVFLTAFASNAAVAIPTRVVPAARKADVQLLQLAIQVRAFEAGLVGHTAHVALLATEELLEVDPFERFARLAQRQIEEARGDLGCNRLIGRRRI